jgi:hypothetical protein
MPGEGRPPSWRMAICLMRHCQARKSSRKEEEEALVTADSLFPDRKNYFVQVDEFCAIT